MAHVPLPLAPRRFLETARKDAWWIQPAVVFLGLTGFVAYSTWAALQGAHYWYSQNGAQYLSPFYSPEFFGDSPHSLFGPKPAWWPGFIPFSAAIFILWMPAGFRFTCYYYRGAYYKAFWADPVSCTVGEPRKSYLGEHSFPLLLQNVHRYFLYLAIVIVLILAYDAWKALWFIDASGQAHFGLGVGSIVLIANTILLGGYTLGCHSLRHLVGGVLDRVSERPLRKRAYDCVSCLNRGHLKWAWTSLIMVAFADLYVRLCSMGIWHDWRLF